MNRSLTAVPANAASPTKGWPVGARRWRADRFGAFANLIRERGGIASPLTPGPFSFDTACVNLGHVSVVIGRNSPLLIHANTPPGTICLTLPLAPGSLHLAGHKWRPGLMTLHGSRTPYTGATPTAASWAVVTANPKAMEGVLPKRLAARVREGTATALVADREAWQRAATLSAAIEEVATTTPEVFDEPEARRSLLAQILETVLELAMGVRGGSRARLLRSSGRREALIQAIDGHMRADAGKPVTAQDLARALDMPPARLRQAVRGTFGIGLSRYLLTRRLLALHAAAAQRGMDSAARRALATAYGFWNSGLLEREYQLLFGEDFFGP